MQKRRRRRKGIRLVGRDDEKSGVVNGERYAGAAVPRCRLGKIFRHSIFIIVNWGRGWPKMYERCPVCDLRFEREPGYFLGAMYISYGLGLVVIAVIAAVLWAVTGWWITKDTVWAVVLFLPLAPAITLFARVLWIYLIRRPILSAGNLKEKSMIRDNPETEPYL